jgi:hypothetical protein
MTIRLLNRRPHAYPAACLLLTALALLPGCIQVRAPDKPIEINLNVKVQQEVIVRLQQDAKDLISNNPELFPQ